MYLLLRVVIARSLLLPIEACVVWIDATAPLSRLHLDSSASGELLRHLTCKRGDLRLRSNCLDVTINAYTLAPLIMMGENIGIVLGPHNTKYPTQRCNSEARKLIQNSTSFGEWSRFINLESEQGTIVI